MTLNFFFQICFSFPFLFSICSFNGTRPRQRCVGCNIHFPAINLTQKYIYRYDICMVSGATMKKKSLFTLAPLMYKCRKIPPNTHLLRQIAKDRKMFFSFGSSIFPGRIRFVSLCLPLQHSENYRIDFSATSFDLLKTFIPPDCWLSCDFARSDGSHYIRRSSSESRKFRLLLTRARMDGVIWGIRNAIHPNLPEVDRSASTIYLFLVGSANDTRSS